MTWQRVTGCGETGVTHGKTFLDGEFGDRIILSSENSWDAFQMAEFQSPLVCFFV